MAAPDAVWERAQAALAAGDVDTAIATCLRFWDETGGPAVRPDNDEGLRSFTSGLTVWRQIDLLVAEINRRPHNPRSWKLLAYAYMWAGLYIPALLRVAEQAWLVCEAHYEDDAAAAANAREKLELTGRALAGDEEARAELAAGEKGFTVPFEVFPEEVPFPEPFWAMGVVDRRTLILNAESLAPELRDDDPR